MIWVVVIVALIALFVVLFKYQDFHSHVSNFIVAGVLLFIVATVGYFYMTRKPDFTSFDNLTSFIRLYFTWMFGIAKNTGDIAGYAIKQNWTAINSTIGSS